MRLMMFMYPEIDEPDWNPSPEEVVAMGRYNEELRKAGMLLALDGLRPPGDGATVSFRDGDVTVTDGPFTEAKEVVGGYAIFDVPSKAHMISVSERFMALHKTHMPGWEGECELRQMAAPGEPEPCGQPRETEAAV